MRLRVTLSGRPPVTCAIDEGVLSAIVTLVRNLRHGRDEAEFDLGGLWRQQHLSWIHAPLSPGDTVTIEILPPGSGDPPIDYDAPATPIDDPVFGALEWAGPVLRGRVMFPHPPQAGSPCAVAFLNVDPASAHRSFRSLRTRYTRLWPELVHAVERAHPEIGQVLRDRPGEVSLHLTFDNDPLGGVQLAYGLPFLDQEVWLVLRNGAICQALIVDR